MVTLRLISLPTALPGLTPRHRRRRRSEPPRNRLFLRSPRLRSVRYRFAALPCFARLAKPSSASMTSVAHSSQCRNREPLSVTQHRLGDSVRVSHQRINDGRPRQGLTSADTVLSLAQSSGTSARFSTSRHAREHLEFERDRRGSSLDGHHATRSGATSTTQRLANDGNMSRPPAPFVYRAPDSDQARANR